MGHRDLAHLRSGNRRLTPQRRLIWDLLHTSRTHWTADQLHEAAAARLPELSQPTVYRTLLDLVEANHVREIAVAHGPSRYEAVCPDDQHSDIVCNVCGHVEKLCNQALDCAARTALDGHAFRRDTLHVVLYSTCERCQAANEDAAPSTEV